MLKLLEYYYCLNEILFKKTNFEDIIHFKEDIEAKCNLYSFAIQYHLFYQSHYRSKTLIHDIRQNYSDLVIPYTNIPISIFYFNRVFLLLYLYLFNPIISLIISIYQYKLSFYSHFTNVLLFKNNWFTYWRLNSVLTTLLHNHLDNNQFIYENKWNFYEFCNKNDFPVIETLSSDIFIKHINKEGGMGCHSYKNVLDGGDYLIQNRLKNSDLFSKVLPYDAPLSTIRIITAKHNNDIQTISSCFRAGTSCSITDHDCICFNIDLNTGILKQGKSNNKWYKNRCNLPDIIYNKHPETQKLVSGIEIPNWNQIKEKTCQLHKKMSNEIPIIGWDIALTNDGFKYLEANYSCNFFNINFNTHIYFKILNLYFTNYNLHTKDQ